MEVIIKTKHIPFSRRDQAVIQTAGIEVYYPSAFPCQVRYAWNYQFLHVGLMK
jgi:hypothetical protein